MNALVYTALLWLSERFQPCCYRQLAIVLSTDLVKPKAVAVLERRCIEALAHNLPHARGDNLLTFILIFLFPIFSLHELEFTACYAYNRNVMPDVIKFPTSFGFA